MVHATDALDWKAMIAPFPLKLSKEPWEWVRVPFEGRSYDKLKESGTPQPARPRLDFCLYFPDARTVVVGDDASLREVIRRPGKSRPDLAGDPGWQEVDRGLIAAACTLDDPKDEPDGITEFLAGLAMDAVPQLPYPRRTFCGITEDETVRLRTSHDYPDAKEAGAAALKSIGELALHKGEFAVLGGSDLENQADPSERFLYRCLMELARNGQVRRDGRMVRVASRCRMPLKELDGLSGGVRESLATDLGNKQAAAKPAQRVTR
jgi:hypothetical protein